MRNVESGKWNFGRADRNIKQKPIIPDRSNINSVGS